jgi:plastocyanin
MTPSAQELPRGIVNRYQVAHARFSCPFVNGLSWHRSSLLCGPLLTWQRIVEVITPAVTCSFVFMLPYCIRIPVMQSSPAVLSSTAEDESVNKRWHRRVGLAFVLVAIMWAPIAQLGRVAGAQEATPVGPPRGTPVGAQPSTPVPGAQTWHVLVNNISPEGENWSFNTFYPDHLRAHPGDTIVFTLAPNPQAFHTVHLLALGMTPMEWYQGFTGGFIQPDLTRPGGWQRTFFGIQPDSACGRAGQDPCVHIDITNDISFGLASAVLVNPPPGGGEGNTSFTVTLDPAMRPGPYYVMSDVDGPTMNGRIDVVAPDQPVQAASELEAAAQRQYEADLAWLAGYDRINYPPEASRPDGTKTWQVVAGGRGQTVAPSSASLAESGSEAYPAGTPQAAQTYPPGAPQAPQPKPWLAINEFAPSQMVVIAGDTVTWTNYSPGAEPHTISGFASTPDAIPQDLSPYQAGCMTSSGELQLPPPGSFPPDIWNTCPGAEVNNLTEHSQPSAPSGDPYTDGERTSGILLNQEYLDSAIGQGLPFASSYSITFPNPGTYYYECAIHPGMIGTVVVIPKPMVR